MNSSATETANSQTFTLPTIVTLVGVAMSLLMASLESTIVGTAMPTVIASLGGIEIYSWVFAAYILASTVMTPIWGKMADLVGRRPAMFGGLILFILGSALSGAAQSMPQLIGFRIIQGLGAAAIFPVGMTIVGDLLTLEQRAKTMPLFSGMWGLASLIGPLIGGYLTVQLSWRWCFYIILPFGMLSVGLIWWSYQEKYERRSNIIFDYQGTITLSIALVLLLLVVERGAEFSWPTNLLMLAGFAAFTLIFIRIEQKHPEPLLPLELFRSRLVTICTAHGFFVMMALIGAMSFLPLFVQAVIGTNAAEAGRVLTPFIFPWVITAIIGGRLILTFGYRPLALTGMGLMMIGAVLLALVSTETTRLGLSIDVVFLGMGGGLTVATLMIAAQHGVPRAQLGVTTATVQFFRSIGSAFGAGAMGALMNWKLQKSLTGASGELARFANHKEIASIIRPETRASLSPPAAAFLQAALAGSLRTAFIFVLGAVLISTIIALFIPGGGAHELAHHEHKPVDLTEEAAAAVPEL
ncbi:MAG: MDR family MFS transporter [Blastocatellales bacterium]